MIITIDADKLAKALATEHAEQRVHIVFDGKNKVDKVERVVNHAHFNKLVEFYLKMVLKERMI